MASTGLPVTQEWKYVEEIQIDSSLADSDQTYIDIFIHEDMLNGSTTLFTYAMSDGGDIRFCASSDGTDPLGFRLVEYNAGSSRIRGFVKVNSLSSSGTTSIYMFYGRASDGQPPSWWNEGWANSIPKSCACRWEFENDYGHGRGPGVGEDHYNLTVGGSPGTGTGKIYQCYDFDGSNDWMSYVSKKTPFHPNHFTLMAWINSGSTGASQYIFSTQYGNAGYRVYINSSTNKIEASIYNGGWRTVTADSAISTSTWYHVAAVFDGTDLKLYIDGVSQGTPQTYSSYTKSNHLFYIGDLTGGGNRFDGLIDEPRLYDTGLTADQVEIFYRMTKDPSGDSYIAGQAPSSHGSGFPSLWSGKIKLTQDSSHISISGDLTDFTALIDKSNLPDVIFDSDGGSAQQYGKDIRITSDEVGTTLIPWDCIRFLTDSDPANGECEIKVKLSTLTYDSDTEIYLWYNASEDMEHYPPTADCGSNNAYDSNVLVQQDMQDKQEDFHEPTVEGMLAWWKADADCYEDAGTDPCEDGDGVYQWDDQSGNGNDLVQSTASNRPTYKTNILNSLPAVRFDGSDDYYNNLNSSEITGVGTVVICCTMDNGDNTQTLISTDSDSENIRRYSSFQSFRCNDNTDSNDFTHDDGTLALDYIYKDAVPAYGQAMVMVVRAEDLADYSTFCMGRASAALGREWDGDVFEVIVYDYIMGEDEVENLSKYLLNKWGFSPLLISGVGGSDSAVKYLRDQPPETSATFYKGQDFDGSNDYAFYNAGLFDDDDEITVWAYMTTDTTSGTHRILGAQSGAGIAWGINGSNARFTTLGIKDYDTAHGFSTSTYYFFGAVFDNSKDVQFFKDNAKMGSKITGSTGASTQSGNYYIGRQGSSEYWNGIIDEFAIDLTTRSDDWMKALGENYSDIENFWSYEIIPVDGVRDHAVGAGVARGIMRGT